MFNKELLKKWQQGNKIGWFDRAVEFISCVVLLSLMYLLTVAVFCL